MAAIREGRELVWAFFFQWPFGSSVQFHHLPKGIYMFLHSRVVFLFFSQDIYTA